MSDVADAITEARSELAVSASEFMPDLCDIIQIGLVSDGLSGHKPDEDEIATNIPCKFDEVPQGEGPIVAGGKTYQATHRIKLPATVETMAIKPSQMIRIQENDNHEQLMFENPVRAKGSMPVFVLVSAKLTTGHRQPGNV